MTTLKAAEGREGSAVERTDLSKPVYSLVKYHGKLI
jgi:hypothetical protein